VKGKESAHERESAQEQGEVGQVRMMIYACIKCLNLSNSKVLLQPACAAKALYFDSTIQVVCIAPPNLPMTLFTLHAHLFFAHRDIHASFAL
jgi:hypothetical protein